MLTAAPKTRLTAGKTPDFRSKPSPAFGVPRDVSANINHVIVNISAGFPLLTSGETLTPAIAARHG
jgi:hypothetical protein